MAEGRLESALARMNADTYFLNGERTENILKKMERQGYIIKIRERDGGGEESVDYIVGPRGKAEIGERGIAGMVRRVYNKKDAEKDELERRLARSLGEVVLDAKSSPPAEDPAEAEEDAAGQPEPRNGRRGGKRQSTRTPGRQSRSSGGLVEDEAAVEEDDEDEDERDEEEEDDEEDEEEEDDE